MFVGLNPSKADENDNDNTVSRCQKFAFDWGYGSLWMMNIFAYCATDPTDMLSAKDPVGIENNKYLKCASNWADIIIACWGNDGNHLNRALDVESLLKNKLWCLKRTLQGEPAHPLYLPGNLKPIKYK